MKLILSIILIALSVEKVRPLTNFSFLRTGLKWITENVGLSEEPAELTQVNSTVQEIVTVGNLLKLPLNINALVTEGLALQTQQIIEQLDEQNNAVSKRSHLLELAASLNLTTLVQRAEQAGLEDVLDHEGPFTLFAPTNEAFLNRPSYCDNVDPKDLMKFHVGRGSVLSKTFKDNLIVNSMLTRRGVRINKYNAVTTANGRVISKPDNLASNGVLHVLDQVMCSVYVGSAIFEINRCPPLSKFSRMVNQTDLYSLFDGPSPVTVFAPTDSAFDKLSPDVLNLLKNITILKEVILYHAVPNVYYKAGLSNGQKLKTIQGQTIIVSVKEENVSVNDAEVTLPDATVSNGVIHSIDTVLLPKTIRHLTQPNPVVKLV